MTDLWDRPVEIVTPAQGGPRCVRSSRDAIAALAYDFPKGCKEARMARKICLNAIEGVAKTETAARAFREAAKQAGILRA